MAVRNPNARINRSELEAMRAVLYAPLPPKADRPDRQRFWTRQRAIAVLRTLDEQPSSQAYAAKTPKGFPSKTTLVKLFGSWNAAMEAAGWTPRPVTVLRRDDELSAQWQARIDAGATLTQLAAELGMTGPALGRRLARHRRRFPRDDYRIPHPGNRAPRRTGLPRAQRLVLDVLAAVTSATPAITTDPSRPSVNSNAARNLASRGYARALHASDGHVVAYRITRKGRALHGEL